MEERQEINDDNVYHKEKITISSGSEKTVILTYMSHMVIASAAAITSAVCVKFKPKFLSQPTQVAIEPSIRRKIKHIATSNSYMNEICFGWEGNRPPQNPKAHTGPLATGAVILEDSMTVELIRAQNRSTKGIEMEAFAVMTVAFNSGPNRPDVLIAKSVCYFADPEKNDDLQNYAAYTSTQFANNLIINESKF